MKVNVKQTYVSIGCNRIPQSADWGIKCHGPNNDHGLVAFGANTFVGLFDPHDSNASGIIDTLPGHAGKVNVVRFIHSGKGKSQRSTGFVSGSTDTTARLWKKSETSNKWTTVAIMTDHTKPINTIGTMSAIDIEDEKDLVVTGASDYSLLFWDVDNDNPIKRQKLSTGKLLPLALAISYLRDSRRRVLAMGSTSNYISIFIESSDGQFQPSVTLSGHEDWIRSLSFATCTSPSGSLRPGELMLCSGSQDKYVRIWSISSMNDESDKSGKSIGLLDAFEESLSTGDSLQLSTKSHVVEILDGTAKKRYNISFEALLLGHDDWVYSVAWPRPLFEDDELANQPLQILTTSSDKSMIVWEPDAASGIWLVKARLGEVGGNSLGFFGGMWSPDGTMAIAHSYHGSFHAWRHNSDNTSIWHPSIAPTGHFAEVKDIAWDPQNRFLVSVSLDQSTRLHAPWKRDGIETWHEIARPQIHGYDINCLAFVHDFTFVSGADEKVLRVFDAPLTFVKTLQMISNLNDIESSNRPLGADVPALGLSNKAVFGNNSSIDVNSIEERSSSITQIFSQPPFEESLLGHTLWPEIEKLYGHGYELVSVSASHDGKWITSACKASTPQHAVIRMYDTTTWKESGLKLTGHSLTITATRFSHDDQYLLSVSRDRQWILYKRQDDTYEFFTRFEKAHARIIWDSSWTHNDRAFATASRDKTIKIWHAPSFDTAKATLKLPEAVTSIAFAPDLLQGRYVLASGLENGQIVLFSSDDLEKWTVLNVLDKSISHSAFVHRISWRKSDPPCLASCSDDNSVRIYTLHYQ